MPENRRIGSESHAPEKRPAHQRQALLQEIFGQPPFAFQQPAPNRAQKSFLKGEEDAQPELDNPSHQRCQCSSACIHPRETEKAKNKNRVENNIDHHSRRADPCTHTHVVGNLHHGQVALRYSRQEIAPAGDSQIIPPDFQQDTIVRKDMHQLFRKEFASREKQNRKQSAVPQHQVKKLFNGTPVAFSKVLCSQDASGHCNGTEKHILYKLNLCCKGDCRHLLLGYLAQHQGISGRNQRQHQTLDDNRHCQCIQSTIKSFVINCSHS